MKMRHRGTINALKQQFSNRFKFYPGRTEEAVRTRNVVNYVSDVGEQRIEEAKRATFDAESWFIELATEEASHKLHLTEELAINGKTKMDPFKDGNKRKMWQKKPFLRNQPIHQIKISGSVQQLHSNAGNSANSNNNKISYNLLNKSVNKLKKMDHKSRVVSGKRRGVGQKYRYNNVAKYLEDVERRCTREKARRNRQRHQSATSYQNYREKTEYKIHKQMKLLS